MLHELFAAFSRLCCMLCVAICCTAGLSVSLAVLVQPICAAIVVRGAHLLCTVCGIIEIRSL